MLNYKPTNCFWWYWAIGIRLGIPLGLTTKGLFLFFSE